MTNKPLLSTFTLTLILLAPHALAATSGGDLPWETPLETIASSLQGPVATSLSILALIGAALCFMFFEVGRALRWFITTIIGFSIVSSAYGLMSLFGLTSALLAG